MSTNKPHKHSELIKAWADGAEIQFRSIVTQRWITEDNPIWDTRSEYRIKPEEKKPVIRWQWVLKNSHNEYFVHTHFYTEKEIKDCPLNASLTVIKKLEYTASECSE